MRSRSIWLALLGSGACAAAPLPGADGGEMVMWTSADQGKTWKKLKQLTRDSAHNHTYARRPLNANPGFYALWADGNPRERSESFLYFTNQNGDHVWRLPAKMEMEEPEVVWGPSSTHLLYAAGG